MITLVKLSSDDWSLVPSHSDEVVILFPTCVTISPNSDKITLKSDTKIVEVYELKITLITAEHQNTLRCRHFLGVVAWPVGDGRSGRTEWISLL